MDILAGYRDGAAIWHRIARVDDQIKNCRLELRRIDSNRMNAGVKVEPESNRIPNRALSQTLKIKQQSIGVQGLGMQHLAARISEELLSEPFASTGRGHRG